MRLIGDPMPAATPATAQVLTSTVWTLRVHTMTGDTVDIPCPSGEFTRISDVKLLLAESNPAWPTSRQRLMPPLRSSLDDAQSVSSAASSSEGSARLEPLDDHCTLGACGIADGATLELLMAEISWNERDSALISEIENAGDTIDLSRRDLDSEAAVAIGWAIVNQVRSRQCRDICIKTAHL